MSFQLLFVSGWPKFMAHGAYSSHKAFTEAFTEAFTTKKRSRGLRFALNFFLSVTVSLYV